MIFSFEVTAGAPGAFPLSLILDPLMTIFSKLEPFGVIADLSIRYFAPTIFEKSGLITRPVSVNSSGVESSATYFLPFMNTYLSLDVGRLPFPVEGRYLALK